MRLSSEDAGYSSGLGSLLQHGRFENLEIRLGPMEGPSILNPWEEPVLHCLVPINGTGGATSATADKGDKKMKKKGKDYLSHPNVWRKKPGGT